MKTTKRIAAMLLAARIEYHWWFIRLYRKRGERLIGAGEPLNSRRILQLNRCMNRHGMIARVCEKKYGQRYVPRPELRT